MEFTLDRIVGFLEAQGLQVQGYYEEGYTIHVDVWWKGQGGDLELYEGAYDIPMEDLKLWVERIKRGLAQRAV